MDSFEIVFRRPRLLHVTLEKKGGPLGLGIKYDGQGTSLTVTMVLESGAAARATVKVLTGDRIVAVNGNAGPSEALWKMIQANDTLELTVSRYE